MRVERIASSRSASAVLCSVAAATARLGLPPPAALSGDWFGARAVIAPSVAIETVTPTDAFPVGVGMQSQHVGGGWVGYLSYPDAGADDRGSRIPEAAGGWTDDVLRQDAYGNWWYESLSGSTAPEWVLKAGELPQSAWALDHRLDRTRPRRPPDRRSVLSRGDRRRPRCTRRACVRSSSVH